MRLILVYIKTLNKFSIGFISAMLTSVIVYHYILIPNTVLERGKDLDLYQYSSKENRFLPKDKITITADELYYLQYGKLKK